MTKPKCPKCGKPIDMLIERFVLECKLKVTVPKKDWFSSEPLSDRRVGKDDYICPKCKKVLTHSGDKAMRILGFWD